MINIRTLFQRWFNPSPHAGFSYQQSKNFAKKSAQNIVFFNIHFEDSFSQILPFFESGFFDPHTTQIVFKYDPLYFAHIVETCEQLNIEWACFSANYLIPALQEKHIFYPFNSAPNAALVANRNCKHILLMREANDQAASINPLMRLYDYVLVAGDVACQRLIEYGVFNKNSISRGRVIKLGTSLIGNGEVFKLSNISPTPDTDLCINYSDPKLQPMSHTHRMDWLHNYVAENTFWEN